VSARSGSSFQNVAAEIVSNTPRLKNNDDLRNDESTQKLNLNEMTRNDKDADEDDVALSRMKTIMKELQMAK